MQIDFYQLGRTPLVRVLAQVAGKIVGDGGRLLVVTGDAAQAEALDAGLWEGEDSFLAHGRAGEGDAGQPILISTECRAGNAARLVALADGVWRDEALAFDRIFYLFGEERTEAARGAWRRLAGADCTRNFWKQDEAGRWTRAA